MQKVQVVQAYILNLDFHHRHWLLNKQVPHFSVHVQSIRYCNPTQIVCATELMIQAKTVLEMSVCHTNSLP